MLKIRGYDIYFRHRPDEWGYTCSTLDGREVDTDYRGVTFCIIEKEGEGTIEEGAFCSPMDIFDKAKGRKISLARAISVFDKEFRTEIWEAYKKETSRL